MQSERNSVRIGIVGFGGFGRFLLKAWSGVDNATVTHIADSADVDVPDGVEAVRSWQTLVRDGAVDVLSIATPPRSHAEIAEVAMSHGCDVLVEKPIATTLVDAERIFKARDLNRRTASVDFMLRFNPIVACLHDWARSRPFGKLQRVVVENYAQDESLGRNHWFWNKEESGGILVEHAVHFFDIVNGATDAPLTNIVQRTWSRNESQEDRVFCLTEFGDGLVATHYHAFNRLNPFERTTMRFVFDGAQVETTGWIPMEGTVLALVNETNVSEIAALPNVSVQSEGPVEAVRSVPLSESDYEQKAADSILTAEFKLSGSKEEAYLSALRSLMSDFLLTRSDPIHSPRVSLEDGLAALRVALGVLDAHPPRPAFGTL